ncbi:MAG: HlyC/CorC family transporter [Clostridia bacterium]|nr:HlyC/CorC family transporter [Clostridia bacterium]
MLLLQVLLIALNAIFACAEIAVISMNETKVDKLAEQGDKRAKCLRKLTVQPAKFLATIQVAITLSGFLGSAFAADNFADPLVDWFVRIFELELSGAALASLDSVAVVVITIILSFFTLIFGELVPKRVAQRKTEALALGMSRMIYFISKLFAPLVFILTASTNGILRLMGIDPNENEESVSEEDIIMMVDAGSEKGTIDSEEQQFIQNVFEFDDLTADEISTHRTEVSLLWMDESIEEWDKTIHDSRHNLYPVCGETVDDVVGVLNTKDYFRLENKDKETVLREAVRPAYFVPETVKADVLFRNMRQTKNFFAVVLDEYGGMHGIITINDLIERLVGDITDEETAEEKEPDIVPLDSETWKISGVAPLPEVAEALQMELPIDEYDTFGGLVFGNFGSVPEDGTTFEIEACGLAIKVTDVKDHQIEAAIVCKVEPEVEVEEEKTEE